MVGQTEESDYMKVGENCFVNVAEKEGGDDVMELPTERDGTVLLSTVQAQFPNAIGLKYKSSSGGWRGIRAADNVLDGPYGGWGETIYLITESNALKRKSEGHGGSGRAEKSSRSSGLLDDIIVLGLPYTTTEDELRTYFTDSCGELAFHELKYERDTKKSRGFGFIRFKAEESAKEALNATHYLQGRKLEVRLSKKRVKENLPTKLFVGRLPSGTTQEDMTEYFSEFGELVDVFVPSPFRGFGFITFSEQEDAMKVLRMSHDMQGARLNITAAEPKDTKGPAKRENMTAPNYNWKPIRSGNSTKLFVGRLPHGTTQNDMMDYFSEFGQLVDLFLPNPFRGFGFVTYASNEDAMKVLRMSHVMLGACLNITVAEPREDKDGGKQQSSSTSDYKWDPDSAPCPHNTYQEPPVQKDVASELKDMLLMLINNQK